MVHLQKAKQCKCYQITASDDILKISKQWMLKKTCLIKAMKNTSTYDFHISHFKKKKMLNLT